MKSDEQQRALGAYVDWMEEIKRRVEVVEGFLSKQCNAMYVQTTAESIALQVRKILELIALSSLVANREAYARHRKNFEKDWHAKRILQTLEKANPSYFPVPYRQIVEKDTGKVTEIKHIKNGYLTKNELEKLFDACCDLLHAENPFSPDSNSAQRFLASVPSWLSRLKKLLNHHTIQLVDRDLQFWVMMKEKESGKARAWLFKKESSI